MLIVKKRPSKLSSSSRKGHKGVRQSPKDPSKKALNFLNFAQLLGALNDNVFKFLTIYFLIDLSSNSHSSEILFWIGVVYVLPFLLFSSLGGMLADRFSKQKLIINLKLLEVVVMALGIPAYYFQSPVACYSIVFLMSVQSALFGPPKYSIIPELVPEEKISKANGTITSSTYLAIILGGFLATFLTQVSNKNFILGAIFCTVIALIGYLFSLGIPKVERQNQKKKMNPIVFQEIYRTLNFCRKSPTFLLAVLGSSFFLFIGAFIQLNIIPYAINTLKLSDVGGGYLFLATSVGIVLGSFLSGKSSKGYLNLGLSSISCAFIGLFFILLPCVSFSIALTVACLAILGFCGGIFVVPLDTYIQTHAPKEKRGEIVACVNFLSFCGVLLAPILLYLFSGVLKLSNGLGFFFTGILNLVFFGFMIRRISSLFCYAVARKLIMPFIHLKFSPISYDMKKTQGIVVKYTSFISFCLIFGLSPKVQLYVLCSKKPWFSFVLKLFKNISYLEAGHTPMVPLITFRNYTASKKDDSTLPCLVLTRSYLKAFEGHYELKTGFEKLRECCDFICLEAKQKFKRSMKKPWKVSQTSIRLDSI